MNYILTFGNKQVNYNLLWKVFFSWWNRTCYFWCIPSHKNNEYISRNIPLSQLVGHIKKRMFFVKIKSIINKVSFRNWEIDEAVMKSDHWVRLRRKAWYWDISNVLIRLSGYFLICGRKVFFLVRGSLLGSCDRAYGRSLFVGFYLMIDFGRWVWKWWGRVVTEALLFLMILLYSIEGSISHL